MSFILDALKKSETDRQQRSSAEFSTVPASSGSGGVPGWLLVVGVLLAVNLIVLLGLWLRSADESAELPAVASAERVMVNPAEGSVAAPTATVAPENQPSFAEQVEQAKRNQPTGTEMTAAAVSKPAPEPAVSLPAIREQASRQGEVLPTIYEVVADGSIVLPELHLDIHVYSEAPAERFVFINMSKHREKSQLGEGPLVEEITPDGVILSYRGKSFLLPRD